MSDSGYRVHLTVIASTECRHLQVLVPDHPDGLVEIHVWDRRAVTEPWAVKEIRVSREEWARMLDAIPTAG